MLLAGQSRWALARLLRACSFALCAAVLAAGAAQARSVSVQGTDMAGFGRILLEFDQPTKVKVQSSGGLVVLSFPEPRKISREKLARELPNYLGAVRQDPDGLGLRLALVRALRVNVLEAGERVYVDLLPPNWVGLPPGLPPEVVEALARRARDAERKLGTDARAAGPEPLKPLSVRLVRMPALTRLIFDAAAPAALKTVPGGIEIAFTGGYRLDAADLRANLAAPLRDIKGQPGDKTLVVALALEDGYEARGFSEDGAYIVDIAPLQAAEATSTEPTLPVPPPVKPAAAAGPAPAPPPAPLPPLAAVPAESVPAPPPVELPPVPEPAPSGPVRPAAVLAPEGLRVLFPFRQRTAAAAYERDGIVTLFFQTREMLDPLTLPTSAEHWAEYRNAGRSGGLATIQFTVKPPHVARLSAEGTGWAVNIGDADILPPGALAATRALDDSGRAILKVALPELSGVHWVEHPETGERLAVGTAFGPVRGMQKNQRFVEMRLLPTLHGLALLAEADDLMVQARRGEVTISRSEGLSVTDAAGGPGTSARFDPVFDRERWNELREGSPLDRVRQAFQNAAEVPRAGRSKARLALARTLIANGFNHEAAGVLAAALSEDPALARDRVASLMGGIATARMGRDAEAARLLAAEHIAEEPEAVLWRAILDARARRWTKAQVGFRRAAPVLERSPEDIQASARILAARAAVETREFPEADRELAAASLLPLSPDLRDQADLIQARIDEANGRTQGALEEYKRLALSEHRQMAAEARLRFVSLALSAKLMEPAEAAQQLETLSVIWRGDELEAESLARLGRLYAETGRWRDAFSVARRASRLFHDDGAARALQEETGRLFESLFLSGRGETMSRIESLALYFDFKEFTPIGRRGDEIVRRLADRLVELDLLDQAGDLLQHQIDKRLTGAARSTVAARLATIRLMDRKPLQALAALQTTRLSELPAAIKRARLLLEARALSELSRSGLALELLAGETGPDIDRLTADIFWTARRWREAGEVFERIIGLRWRGREPLSEQDRRDVLRAAVAYALGDEKIGLDRLRTKMSAKMAESPDARTFAFITRPEAASTQTFRDVARAATEADTLSEFLAEYRKRHPEAAETVAPARRLGAEAAVSSPPPT